MIVFQDMYQNEVHLSFSKTPFSNDPLEITAVTSRPRSAASTDHRERGIEFPGGKVEEGETPESAAVREVMEETGGEVDELLYLGQYKVIGKGKTIIKNIYFATINKLIKQDTYFETNGPKLLTEIPANIPQNRKFSFIMKDGVLTYSLKEVEQYIK